MADVNTNTATQTQEQGNSTQTNTTANANTTGAGADTTPKVKTEEEIRAELQKEYEKMADKRVTDAIKKKEKEWLCYLVFGSILYSHSCLSYSFMFSYLWWN